MRSRWIAPMTIAMVVLVLDRWTKVVISKSLVQGGILVLMPFLNIVHVGNRGGAFGVGSGGGYRSSFFFIVVSILAVMVIVSLMRKLPPGDRLTMWSLGAVLGGGLGNLVDRVLYGRVIDFIDLHISGYHWPAFNVADSAITVGLAFALWGYFRRKRLEGD